MRGGELYKGRGEGGIGDLFLHGKGRGEMGELL